MKSGKGAQVQDMFDDLAPRYDLMNRIMTLGQDQRWRRFVVEQADLEAKANVLDLAAGTGDIAFEVKRRFPEAVVYAGDFSIGMLHCGRRRPGGDGVLWVGCDAMSLPFSDGVFDAVTFGYLLRNVENIDTALSEVWRVLKPGGRVVCLDTVPPSGFLGPFIRAYLRLGLPLLGRLFAGNPDAYTYLSDSTLGFQDPESLKRLFVKNGFGDVSWRNFMFKTVAVHWARKPSVSSVIKS